MPIAIASRVRLGALQAAAAAFEREGGREAADLVHLLLYVLTADVWYTLTGARAAARYVALLCVALCCIAARCVALLQAALHCCTLRCIARGPDRQRVRVEPARHEPC